MDSLKVLLQTVTSSEPAIWQILVDYLFGALPLVVAIVVPLYTLRHTRKLKELELADTERGRKFQLERPIAEKAIEVMGKSYHLTHKINAALNFYWEKDEPTQEKIKLAMLQAREYWEEHLFYLPSEIRNHILPLTNLSSFSLESRDQDLTKEAIEEVKTVLSQIERNFDAVMKEYNLFDRFGR